MTNWLTERKKGDTNRQTDDIDWKTDRQTNDR